VDTVIFEAGKSARLAKKLAYDRFKSLSDCCKGCVGASASHEVSEPVCDLKKDKKNYDANDF